MSVQRNKKDLRNVRTISMDTGEFASDIPVTLEVGVFGCGQLYVRPAPPQDQPEGSGDDVYLAFLMRGIVNPEDGDGFEPLGESYPEEMKDLIASRYDAAK